MIEYKKKNESMKIFIIAFLSTTIIVNNFCAALPDKALLENLREAYHQDDGSELQRTPRGQTFIFRKALFDILNTSDDKQLKNMLLAVYWYGTPADRRCFVKRIHERLKRSRFSSTIALFPGWISNREFPSVFVQKDAYSFSDLTLLKAVFLGGIEDVRRELADRRVPISTYIQTAHDEGQRFYPLISFAVLKGCHPSIVAELAKHSTPGMRADARLIAYGKRYEQVLALHGAA